MVQPMTVKDIRYLHHSHSDLGDVVENPCYTRLLDIGSQPSLTN